MLLCCFQQTTPVTANMTTKRLPITIGAAIQAIEAGEGGGVGAALVAPVSGVVGAGGRDGLVSSGLEAGVRGPVGAGGSRGHVVVGEGLSVGVAVSVGDRVVVDEGLGVGVAVFVWNDASSACVRTATKPSVKGNGHVMQEGHTEQSRPYQPPSHWQ